MVLFKWMILLSAFCSGFSVAQTAPVFGPETLVTINSLTFDAMEPSISTDGNYLFFNSRNDGITTSLYYATRVNDHTFNYAGPLVGANQTVTPRLDGVASSDQANHFYWTSTRDFPSQMDNCFHGQFNGSDVTSIGRLHGTFYIYAPGWIMMDAAIDQTGSLLYYTNAYFGPGFNSCGNVPCVSKLGVAAKLNDSTFNKLANSDSLFKNVNDTNYAVYAPCISSNGLELYHSRFLKNNISAGTQVCVSVRNSHTAPFGIPSILYPSSVEVPEAPTLTSDMSIMYYHKLVNNLFRICMRKRDLSSGITVTGGVNQLNIYPNPGEGSIHVTVPKKGTSFCVELFHISGARVAITCDQPDVDLNDLPGGVYVVRLMQGDLVVQQKFIKQ